MSRFPIVGRAEMKTDADHAAYDYVVGTADRSGELPPRACCESLEAPRRMVCGWASSSSSRVSGHPGVPGSFRDGRGCVAAELHRRGSPQCALVETVSEPDTGDTARIGIPIRSDAIQGRCSSADLDQRPEVVGRMPG